MGHGCIAGDGNLGGHHTTSGSDIPESHADRTPEVEYSERLKSRRPQDEGGTEGLCSPNMELEMAVIRLQKDFDDCRTELELARKHTPAVALRPPRRSGFTSTSVTRYSGKSNWEQYREVFEAIVRSNGWDDVTAALQLLSHLDGDALCQWTGGMCTPHTFGQFGTGYYHGRHSRLLSCVRKSREVEIEPQMRADRRPARAICQVTVDEQAPAASPQTETLEDIIKKLLPTPALPLPQAVPIPSDRDLLIQRLMGAICPPKSVAQERSAVT